MLTIATVGHVDSPRCRGKDDLVASNESSMVTKLEMDHTKQSTECSSPPVCLNNGMSPKYPMKTNMVDSSQEAHSEASSTDKEYQTTSC